MLHREWGCASLAVHILTGKGDVIHSKYTSSPPYRQGASLLEWEVHHWECTSSLGMGMGVCFTGNAHSHPLTDNAHPHPLTRSRDVSCWECTSSLGMGIRLTGKAHPHREYILFRQGYFSFKWATNKKTSNEYNAVGKLSWANEIYHLWFKQKPLVWLSVGGGAGGDP